MRVVLDVRERARERAGTGRGEGPGRDVAVEADDLDRVEPGARGELGVRRRPGVGGELGGERSHRRTASACAGMPSTAASASTIGRTRARPCARQALHRHRLQEGLEPEAADRAGPPAGGQHVVPAGRVVARRHRRPGPDEDGAGVANPRRELLRLLAEQHEVLRRELLHAGERALEVAVRLHETTDGVGPVLPLGGELELGDLEVGAVGGEDDHLRGPCGEVDRDVARDEQLRLVHECVSRADDLVDGRDRLRPVGHGGDRLRPAHGPDLLQPEQLGRRATMPAPAGGVATTIRSTPATSAGTAHMTSVETSRRGT